MLSELLKKKSLFYHLYKIDKETAEQYRQLPCPYCGGSLYFGNYLRKPRGEPDGIPEEYFIRFSLCCGTEGCRRRLIPPSCRFLDRKVYWFVVILSLIADRQNGTEKITIFELSLKTGISRNTIKRWICFFYDTFPASRTWLKIRGQVSACVSNNKLPASIVNYYLKLKSCAKDALVSCLVFLSGGSDMDQKIRAG